MFCPEVLITGETAGSIIAGEMKRNCNDDDADDGDFVERPAKKVKEEAGDSDFAPAAASKPPPAAAVKNE